MTFDNLSYIIITKLRNCVEEVKRMYPNVRAEMARHRITGQMLADHVGITAETMSLKLNGKAKLTLSEAFAIKEALKTDMPMEILFEVE